MPGSQADGAGGRVQQRGCWKPRDPETDLSQHSVVARPSGTGPHLVQWPELASGPGV